jgi:transcriptional regulator GlxA family with amidase domain
VNVGILLFDNVDLLDAGGPYEVFLTASRLRVREGAPPPLEVITFSHSGGPVTAYGGLGLVPHRSLADVGSLDVVIIPGAIAIHDVLADADVMAAARSVVGGGRVVASVCTGAFILADIGLLDGVPWTTHWEDIPDLERRLGGARAVHDVKWVDNGDVVTSGGLSSGMAMALHLVDRLAGRDLAERTARQLGYDWRAAATGEGTS